MAKAGFVGKLVFMQDYNIENHFNWEEWHEPQKNADEGLEWVSPIDTMYRDFLCRLHVSDNMAFIGRKA
jgi:hypothetical protein